MPGEELGVTHEPTLKHEDQAAWHMHLEVEVAIEFDQPLNSRDPRAAESRQLPARAHRQRAVRARGRADEIKYAR